MHHGQKAGEAMTTLTEEAFDELVSEWFLAHARNVSTYRLELEVGVGHQAYKVTRHWTFDLKQPVPLYKGDNKQAALLAYNENREVGLGYPGIRDPDSPCECYGPGRGEEDCPGDGHYLCRECKHYTIGAFP